ncbi:celCCD, partial [Symbiodinium necroappetens]
LLASKFRVALNLLTDPLLPLVTPLPASRVPAPVWTRQPMAPGFSPKQHELSESETAKMSWPELDPALSSPRQVTKARGQGQPKRGARRSSMKSMKKALDFTFTVVFTGYDHEKHAEFELVPRLIGKRGCNMLPIQNIGAAARVCGRGSGYKEVHTADGQTVEKDETLQLAVACRTNDMHDAALRLVQPLLNDLSHHFRRFCRKKGLECPDLYILAAKQAPCLPCLDSGSIAGRRESCRLQMADIVAGQAHSVLLRAPWVGISSLRAGLRSEGQETGKSEAADALDVASLIQTLTAQKADADEVGRALQEADSTDRHSKALSIQTEATLQSEAQAWSCSSTVQNMSRGINIGNVYDFDQGNRDPAVVKEQVKWAHDEGFRHIRLPVTWDGYFDANSQLTKQVTEVVDYALGLGLHVVINTHHEHWLKDGYDGSQHYKDQFWNLWTGIAGHFAYKSSRLSFEVLNEPDKAFGSWNGNPDPYDQIAIDRTREINGLGYSAIRSVEGNQDRMIFLHPNAMSSIGTAKSIYPSKSDLPGDGNDACVGVTVHTYDPYDFCGENGRTEYYANSNAMKKDLSSKFKDIRDWAFDQLDPRTFEGSGRALAGPELVLQILFWSVAGTVQNMGRGINLGNVYDFNQGNRDPAVVKRQVQWAHDQGFGHVRVPVTWDGHFDANSQLTKQVTEVVDYALGLGLHVVINTHHEHWLKDGYDGSQHYKDQFWNLWTGIAGHFAYKSSRLSFEVLNEPDKAFGSWNGNPHPYDQLAIDRTREVNGLGYAAIRSVAGNQDRMIFLHPNAMSSIGTAKALYPSKWSLPGGGKDACVGVTVHTYDPYDFCGENGHSNYYANPSAMKKDLIFKFKDLRDWAFDSHIPVYVGEYGVGRQMDRQWDRNNENVREYYKFV